MGNNNQKPKENRTVPVQLKDWIRALVAGEIAPLPLPSGSKVLFVGNPGAGKSTLLNSILQKKNAFKSGVSFGSGKTQIFTSGFMEGIEYIDTPGLSDLNKRKEAAEEIKKALSQDGIYYLFFVIKLDSGRVRSDDSTTIKLVHDALSDIPNLSYGIIVNQCSEQIMSRILRRDSDEIVAAINTGLSSRTTNVYFHKWINAANDRDDYLLPRSKPLMNFIGSVQPMKIDRRLVKAIKSADFEELKSQMDEESAKLREDNESLKKLIEEIRAEYKSRVQNLEKEVDELKKFISKISGTDTLQKANLDVLQTVRYNFQEDKPPNENIHLSIKKAFPHITENFKEVVDRVLYSESVKDLLDTIPGLTVDMVGALTYYTLEMRGHDSIYKSLNEALRNANGDLKKVSHLSEYLWYAFQAYKKLPKYNGTTYRRTELPISQLEENYTVGSMITFNSFTSSSSNPTIFVRASKEEGTTMIFKSTFTGISLKKVSCYPIEEEVLFFPGSMFEVLEVRHNTLVFAENAKSTPVYNEEKALENTSIWTS